MKRAGFFFAFVYLGSIIVGCGDGGGGSGAGGSSTEAPKNAVSNEFRDAMEKAGSKMLKGIQKGGRAPAKKAQ
jgi:hypothetical protein